MFDVVTFGSAVLDVFLYTGVHEMRAKGSEFIAYKLGEKFLVKDLNFFTGGGGSNTAVGFSRLGLRTGVITKVGNDWIADKILNELKKEKVKFLCKKTKGGSAFSVVLDSFEH